MAIPGGTNVLERVVHGLIWVVVKNGSNAKFANFI